MPLSRAQRRHGRRTMRSAITGAILPAVASREHAFVDVAADAVSYLRSAWPTELGDVRFLWADMPPRQYAAMAHGLPAWNVDARARRITIYRLPIQRQLKLHVDDELHRRLAIEGIIFRAAGELIGRDPWDVAPGRYGHH